MVNDLQMRLDFMEPTPTFRSFPKLEWRQLLDPVQEDTIVSLTQSGTRLLDEDPATGLTFGKKKTAKATKTAK